VHEVTCIELGESWHCVCRDAPSFTVAKGAIGDDVCGDVLGYCPITFDAYECARGELRIESDLCLLPSSCSYGDVQAGDPVESRTGFQTYCVPAGEDWACVCSGFGPALRFKLFSERGETVEQACHPSFDVCMAGAEPARSTVSECLLYGVTTDEASCQLSALCSDAPVAFRDRQIAAQRIHGVRCERAESDWVCSCHDEPEADRLPAAEMVASRSELVDEALPCVDQLVAECGGVFE
jgi:hypothetical protein